MNIQIMKIYKESLHDLRVHKLEWVKVAYGPVLVFVLGVLLLALAYGVNGNPFGLDLESGEFLISGEISSFFILSHVVFAITTFIAIFSLYINGYRYAVLQDGADRWITLNLNMRFVKMVLYGILFNILYNIYVWISAVIIGGADYAFDNMGVNILLGTILSLFGFYLILRVILYPVVISIDQRKPFRTSWYLMKGNILRLIGLFILVWITISIIGIVGAIVLGLVSSLLALLGTIGTVSNIILWGLFGLFMMLISWAFSSKALGLVYLEVSGSATE